VVILASSVWPAFRSRPVRAVIGAVLAWHAITTVRNHPWHISYFNETIGRQDNGYRYLTDSNVDWGQGLKELGKYMKARNAEGIYFCYFGTGDPHYYGIRYRPIGFVDNISPPWAQGHRAGDVFDPSRPPALLAVSATNLQSTYYADPKLFSWLKKVPPEAVLARSILVYDLSKQPQTREDLSSFLKRTGA
jgi:hypothetical protein